MKGNLLAKISAAYMSPKNACRTIRRLIKRTPGVALNIDISVCEVHVRLRKPIRPVKVFWPVISLQDWVRYLVANKPELLLAGHPVGGAWRKTFSDFWTKYEKVDSSHPIFREPFDRSSCVPFHLHGDEGRGQLRRPYLVVAWQCLIGHRGMDYVNDTGLLGHILKIF